MIELCCEYLSVGCIWLYLAIMLRTHIECGFTLKCVCDMIAGYSQMDCTDKYSQDSSINWLVWPNGWVFLFELSGCGFESFCSYLNFGYCACFKEGVPWHSGKYRVWIHSEMGTWHHNKTEFLKCIHLNSINYRSRFFSRFFFFLFFFLLHAPLLVLFQRNPFLSVP